MHVYIYIYIYVLDTDAWPPRNFRWAAHGRLTHAPCRGNKLHCPYLAPIMLEVAHILIHFNPRDPGGDPGGTLQGPWGNPGRALGESEGDPGRALEGSLPGGRPGSHPGGRPGNRPEGRPGGYPRRRPGCRPGGRPGSRPGGCDKCPQPISKAPLPYRDQKSYKNIEFK